jgi:hypothetical protein
VVTLLLVSPVTCIWIASTGVCKISTHCSTTCPVPSPQAGPSHVRAPFMPKPWGPTPHLPHKPSLTHLCLHVHAVATVWFRLGGD